MPSSLRLALLSIAVLAAVPASAQNMHYEGPGHRPPPPPRTFDFGAYILTGVSHATQPLAGINGLQGQLGLFADYARHRLRPGIDTRISGENYSFPSLFGCCNPGGSAGQQLMGPRLSFVASVAQPYVEILFGEGQNEATPQADYYSGNNNGHTVNASGTATVGVMGCDFAVETHVHLRAEYTIGSVSNLGFPIRNASAGLVFRFP